MRDQSRLFIASDANADGLLETAWKAARKPARGGILNLICIAEPLEVLATELESIAERLTVILPWGSLLRAVAAPEATSLLQIASLCSSKANIEIVFSFDPHRDAAEGARLGIAHLDGRYITSRLPEVYRRAGLQVEHVQAMPFRELAEYETSWAKRLATGRERNVWRIRATCK